MGGKASKADKPEEVFFENESGNTAAAAAEAEEDAADGSGGELAEAYSAEASEDEAVVEAAPREPTPPPVVASPLPESENKFAKRFKERSGSFKKGAAGDSAAQSAVNNADGQKLPTKVTPVVELSVDRGEVKRRCVRGSGARSPARTAAQTAAQLPRRRKGVEAFGGVLQHSTALHGTPARPSKARARPAHDARAFPAARAPAMFPPHAAGEATLALTLRAGVVLARCSGASQV